MRHYDQARKGTRKPQQTGIVSDTPVPDRVQYLECGLWLRALGQHVRHAHGLPVADYRAKHGLANDVPMVGDATRERLLDRWRAPKG